MERTLANAEGKLASTQTITWRHWTYKMPVRYILSSVWVRLSIFSVIHYTICGAVSFQFTHFSYDDWDNIYILCLIIIIKPKVWSITHCLGLGHETMVYAFLYSYVISPTLNFPRPPRNRAPQSSLCPHRHGRSAHTALPPTRLCVNIVNMPGSGAGISKSDRLLYATASCLCEPNMCSIPDRTFNCTPMIYGHRDIPTIYRTVY